MIKQLLFSALLLSTLFASAQKKRDKYAVPPQVAIDSITFHLYTDSLKKGVHNYINVDGHLTDGSWQPLTSNEITFHSDAGKFEGNSLLLDQQFKGEKVTITATFIRNPKLTKTVTIYIKTTVNTEKLKTKEEILEELRNDSSSKKKKGLLA